MLKSLYSGVSGMKGFQTQLDTIGNNIANVDTVGFKKSRVIFQDIVNQNLSGATAPTATSGGINPQQVGLGSKIGSIDTIHTPGSPMTTNVGTDLAVDGDAYFVVSNGTQDLLTKAGNFNRDANGTLVNANGYKVVGVNDDAAGNTQEFPIAINQDDKTGQKFTSFSIDANGKINVVSADGKSGQLAYDSGTKQYYLNDGTANTNQILSIGTALVNNPSGLAKVGDTAFETTANSGAASVDRIDNNKGGQILSGTLEMSNVDLSEEFTEMIVAQRGFEANAKTITTSDSILQDLINLKGN